MPSRFLNLPRIELTTLDGQLVAIQDRPITEAVLIIGPAVDGPTDRPIRVNTVGEVESIFGPLTFNTDYIGPNGEVGTTDEDRFNGNMLMKALREVQAGGCADIRLMRVGGTKATGTFTNSAPSTGTTGTVTATALYPGRIYNQVTVTFASGAISGYCTISQPTVKGGNVTIAWNGISSGLTVVQVLDRINSHPQNRTVRLSLGTITGTALGRNLQGSVTLSAGTDGTNKDDLSTDKHGLYTNLTTADTGTFALLQDYEVDIVMLAGIYLDDQVVAANTTTSIADAFADWLGKRTVDHPMLGVIGVRPLQNAASRTQVNDHYTALINPNAGTRETNWLNAGYFMNRGFTYRDGTLEQPIDTGAYLQVVAADVIISDNDIGLYVESAAGIYAGALSALRPHLPATHKSVPGVMGLPYEFTRAQLDYLNGGIGQDLTAGREGTGAYVTVRRIEGRGILFTRDVTAANRRSDFKDLQPLRIANAVHKGVKEISFPFLGQPNDLPHRQALTTAIKTFLDSMYDAGALLGREGQGYRVQVKGGDTPLSNLLGILEIDLVLRPALQIKAIRIRVRMSL